MLHIRIYHELFKLSEPSECLTNVKWGWRSGVGAQAAIGFKSHLADPNVQPDLRTHALHLICLTPCSTPVILNLGCILLDSLGRLLDIQCPGPTLKPQN